MVNNISKIAEVSALLNICFESQNYKKLNTSKALQLFELDIRLTDLAESISDHFDDKALLMTYEFSRIKFSSENELISISKRKYNYCNNNLFVDVGDYVSEHEKLFYEFFNR